MASLSVLTFDHEGRPIQFDTWLDDLQLYLLSDSRDSVSLFDHTSGASLPPPATADSANRPQWLTRDAAARLAVHNHLPLAERAHIGQHKTAKALYDASRTSKRRSSKGKGGKSGGGGSGGGGGVGGGGGRGGGSTGSGGGSGGFGGSGGGSGGGGGGGGGSSGSGGGGNGGGQGGAAQRGGSRSGQRQQQRGRSETPMPQQLREWFAQRGASGGSVGCPYVIRTSDHASQTCGKMHTQHHYFSRLDDAWRVQFGDEAEHPGWAELLRSGDDIFALDYDAIRAAMYALSVSAEGDCYLCVPLDPDIEAASLGASESTLPGTAPAEALHTFTLDSGASRFLARSSTVLPCPAVPFGSLSGLHLPSFSTNLVATSALVSTSGPVAAPCSCGLVSHQTLRWQHRLGHPSLPRLLGMHSRLLVSGFPRSLPPLPPSPAPPCLPCAEGRQCAAPHSSWFPPTTAPLQTLHMDVWGTARVSGQGRERYLLVVDDYTRYTTVFPLHTKGEILDVLIPWIRAVRLLLRERFHQDLLVVRLHSDRGGEFSFDLLQEFCHGEGILQSFTLSASSQQNGIAKRRIGLVMELNLWPRVSLAETSPTLHWTGKVGDASVFRVCGSRAFVRDTSADKLSSRAISCVFLGFPPNTLGWQFYHPTSRRVLPSQGVTFDESVPFYRPPPVDPLPPHGPAPSGVSQVDPLPEYVSVKVPVDSGAARGAVSGGAASGGTAFGGAEPARAEPGGAEPPGAELGEPWGANAESGGAEPRGTTSAGGPAGASPRLSPRREPLSAQQWFAQCTCLQSGTARAGGSAAGGCGAGGIGATRLGGVGVTAIAGGTGGARAAGPGGARTRFTGAARAGGVGGAGALDPGAGDLGAGGTSAGGDGAGGTRAGDSGVGGTSAGGAGAGGAGVGDPGARGAGAGGTGTGDPGAGGAGGGGAGASGPGAGGISFRRRRRLCRHLTGSFARFLPVSCPVLLVCAVRIGRRVPRLCPPHVPGTRVMVLLPSSVPLRVPLPTPPTSSLPGVPDPESDLARAASPTVPHLLATVVNDPSFESTAASAIVAELVDFAAACHLDYATILVAESEQEDFECLAAAVPHLVAMLLASEGDPDAPDIPTPHSYAKAITGPYSSRWQTTMDTEMASWKSTGTYVDAVPLSGANMASGFLGLRRPVYGLRQAPREWHDTVRTTLAALGVSPSTADPSLLLRTGTSLPPFYVLMYVDDLVFATGDTEALALVKSELQKRHTCTYLGPAAVLESDDDEGSNGLDVRATAVLDSDDTG
ncbi:unnamed protein product [Closterium sp. NIES-53]